MLKIFFSLRLLFLTGLLGSGLAQVDDFSCPDEFEGFYPHLYRSVSPSLSLSLSHQGVNRVTQLKDREASVVCCVVVCCGVLVLIFEIK